MFLFIIPLFISYHLLIRYRIIPLSFRTSYISLLKDGDGDGGTDTRETIEDISIETIQKFFKQQELLYYLQSNTSIENKIKKIKLSQYLFKEEVFSGICPILNLQGCKAPSLYKGLDEF